MGKLREIFDQIQEKKKIVRMHVKRSLFGANRFRDKKLSFFIMDAIKRKYFHMFAFPRS